FPPWL
uniref:Tryptophyllin-T2-3 n=2 Tax=Pithecopus TaxID=1911155 RepID=TY23_PITAZ